MLTALPFLFSKHNGTQADRNVLFKRNCFLFCTLSLLMIKKKPAHESFNLYTRFFGTQRQALISTTVDQMNQLFFKRKSINQNQLLLSDSIYSCTFAYSCLQPNVVIHAYLHWCIFTAQTLYYMSLIILIYDLLIPALNQLNN